MQLKQRVRSLIGKYTHAASPKTASTTTQTFAPTTPFDDEPMTPERFAEHTYRRLDAVNYTQQYHKRIGVEARKLWCAFGPFATAGVTVLEVYYIMNLYLAHAMASWMIAAISGIVEAIFIAVTFDQEARTDEIAEKRSKGQVVTPLKERGLALALWVMIGAVIGYMQVFFLSLVMHVPGMPFTNPAYDLAWLFIIVRSASLLIGDTFVAFAAKPIPSTGQEIAGEIKRRTEDYMDVSAAINEQRRKQAEADASIAATLLELERKKQEQEIIAQVMRAGMRSLNGQERQY